MSTQLIPCAPGACGRAEPRARRGAALSWLLGLGLLLTAFPVFAVEFPGPRGYSLPAPALSVLPVRQPGLATDDLVVGTATGRLILYRYSQASNNLELKQELLLGGRLGALVAWSGLPLSDRGVVAAAADPDRAWFVRVRASYPYLQVVTGVDLDEDPGSLAWFGDVAGGNPRLAVSLPGLDTIAVLGGSPAWRVVESLPVGDMPASITGADLDGDGSVELVAAERGYLSGDLLVATAGAGGTNLRYCRLPGVVAGLVAAVDGDGDGIDEVLVADRDQPRLVVAAADGAGFVVRSEVALALPAGSLHVWERGSGGVGAAVANQARGSVEVVTGNADGWLRQETYFPGCLPACGVTALIDGDGLPDLVAVGGQVLSVLLARSDATFWGLPSLALDAVPGDLVHGDFDGDGRVDLLVSPALGSELSLFAARDGGLAPDAVAQPLAFAPGKMVALDLDADAAAEVAVLDMLAGDVVILDRDAGGALVEAGRLPVGEFPTFLAAGDIDADGHADLLALHADPTSAQLYFGSGGTAFSGPVTLTYDIGTVRAALVDLNADGLLDVVGVDGSSRVWWRVNLGGRAFGPGQWVHAGAGAVLLATGDLDGDGDQDVVVGCRVDHSLVAFENPGTGVLARRTGSTMLESEPYDVRIADLDQDGSGDVVVNLRDQDRLDVYLSIVPWNQMFNLVLPGTPDVEALDVVDADRDGVQDLVALDGALRLGVVHRNIDPANVAVETRELACACRAGGGLAVRIEPVSAGPWELSARADGDWITLAADGIARIGALSHDGRAWDLELTAADLAASGPVRELRLVAEGAAGRQQVATARAPDGCGGAARADTPAWRAGPWPNPGNPAFSARFFVPREGPARVTVCDLAGRRVATLHEGVLAAGEHEVRWDGRGPRGDAAAGAYVMVVEVAGGRLARKLVLLR